MLPLIPLISLASGLVPELVGLFGGRRAGEVAGKVSEVVRAVAGAETIEDAAKAIREDTAKASELKLRLEAIRRALVPKVGPYVAAQQALGVLYRTLVAQANLLAFVDNFRLMTILAVCMMPLALLLKRVRARGAAGGAH